MKAKPAAPAAQRPWPAPTPEMLNDPRFEAIWQCIKNWDINVPDVYQGYMGANGNHVLAILDALAASKVESPAKTPPRCDQDIFENGKAVAIIAELPAVAIEELISNVRLMSGHPVDWHYVAGRAVVKTTGDVAAVVREIRTCWPKIQFLG